VAAIPLLGMLGCLPFQSDPERLKRSAVAWVLISLGSVVAFAGHMDVPPEGLLPLYLLPLAATISILGQPVHEHHRPSWMLTLLFLGLGLSVFSTQPRIGLPALPFL